MTQPPAPPTPPAPPPGDPAPPAPPTNPPADPPKPDQPLGEAGLKALREEREARKALEAKLAKLEPLAKLADAITGEKPTDGRTDAERLNERLAKHEADLTAERQARWRAEAAAEKGLTPAQAARLIGSTREELLADADALKAMFPTAPAGPGTPKPDPSQGGSGGTPGPDLDTQIREAQAKGDYRAVIRLNGQKAAALKK